MSDYDPNLYRTAYDLAEEMIRTETPGQAAELVYAAIAVARAEEREACAKLVEQYSFSKPFLHPDIAWDDMNENARMVCHMTCQTLAYDIRALKDNGDALDQAPQAPQS